MPNVPGNGRPFHGSALGYRGYRETDRRMESARGKEAGMTDLTPEQRAAFREKAAAAMDRSAVTQNAAQAHMRFSKMVALIQLALLAVIAALLAVIAAGVWLR